MSQRKLPNNAKRVFRGVIFDVWQWRQKMFDGSFETFEKIKRPDTVNVIPVVGKKIMVLEQIQPDWKKSKVSIAGGRVDEGEKPFAAAKRELLEETGCLAKKWILWSRINPSQKIVWTVHNYIARNCESVHESCPDAGEKIKTKLITFEEFLMLSERPDFYEGEIKHALLKARFDSKYRREFKKLLFG